MPTDAAALRAAAARADQDAATARDVALDLERHNQVLEHRLAPVLDRHVPETWSSRAATASRLRLRVSATANLGRARAALTEVTRQVRRRADILEETARDHRRAADHLDALAAEAAAAAAWAGIDPPAVFDPPGSSSVPVPDGVR